MAGRDEVTPPTPPTVALLRRVERLPRDLRRLIARLLAAPYLGHAELRRAHGRLVHPNRWCRACGEADRRGAPRMMMLCWACERTVCYDCWQGSRCCVCADIATGIMDERDGAV